MNLIIDATALRMYPVGKPATFRGGTETYVQKLASSLAAKGHIVHVVTPDLEREEHRASTEWWWPADYHPTQADAVVMMHRLDLQALAPYSADLLILATNGCDPDLGPDGEWAKNVDAYPCFSQTHIDLLCRHRPTVDKCKCFVTGLGVDVEQYNLAAPFCRGRMLYANDPSRGLWHVLDIFEHVKREVPEATLHIAYDFQRQFEHHRWRASALAELLWECRKRIANTEGVVDLGGLTTDQLVQEQLACQVHVMPSDPPNTGSQIHGITQMECAAAGAALVLSDTEAFPEVFSEAATILPLPGTFLPEYERRVDAQDWADVVVELMRDETMWLEASRKARALAEKHTWDAVIEKWEAMLAQLREGAQVAA